MKRFAEDVSEILGYNGLIDSNIMKIGNELFTEGTVIAENNIGVKTTLCLDDDCNPKLNDT